MGMAGKSKRGLRVRPAASALVVRDGHVLMVHGNYPWEDCWALPGGGHERGETLAECVEREVLEETGVVGRAMKLMQVREYISERDENCAPRDDRPNGTHRLDHLWWVQPVEVPDVLGGEHGDPHQDKVEWVPLAKVKELSMVPVSMPGELAEMVERFQRGEWEFQYVGHRP